MTHGAVPLNLSLEWPSVWEGKSLKFQKGKLIFLGVQGAEGQRGFAENELKLPLSMKRIIIEIPKENEGFQRSWGVMHGAGSQKMSLSCPSVWGGKSLKFLRKTKDSRGPGGRCTARFRRI